MEQANSDEEGATPTSNQSGYFDKLFSSPYHFATACFLLVPIVAAWYLETQLEPRLEDQSANTKDVLAKLDKLSDDFQDFRVAIAEKDSLVHSTSVGLATQINNAQLQRDEIKDRIAEFSTELNTANNRLNAEFIALRETIQDEVRRVTEKTNSTEQKVDEKLANMPEAESMVDQLVQQKTAIEDTGRGVNILKTLVQLGIEHPSQRQALQTFAENNSQFSDSPTKLAALWESRSNYTKSLFAQHIQDNYTITPTDTMLLAYDELTETKPIRFFVDKKEIQNSAEPSIGAAKVEPEESEVPLAKPLTIARVCAEMRKSTIECYEYFLKNTVDIADDVISFDSPSDSAVMKLIIDKHQSKISKE